MDLAIQTISNDKTMRNKTVQGIKDFNSRSLATRGKKGKRIVSLMPAN